MRYSGEISFRLLVVLVKYLKNIGKRFGIQRIYKSHSIL